MGDALLYTSKGQTHPAYPRWFVWWNLPVNVLRFLKLCQTLGSWGVWSHDKTFIHRANFYSNASKRTGTGFFQLPQLEQGSVATPWRNAPADDGPIVWKVTPASTESTNTS